MNGNMNDNMNGNDSDFSYDDNEGGHEIDLDVDHYSLQELIEILKLEFPITMIQIKTKVDNAVNDILNQEGIGEDAYDDSGKTQYIQFFKDMENRLLDNFDKIKVLTQGNLTFQEESDNVKAAQHAVYQSQMRDSQKSGILASQSADADANVNANAIISSRNGGNSGNDTMGNDEENRGNMKMENTYLENTYNDRVKTLLPSANNNKLFYNKNDDFVVKHETLKTVATYNQNYIQGTINPLKKRILKKVLLVDSRFRRNYDATQSTNFDISLPTTIKNVVSMKLTSLEFPVSFYVFSDKLRSNEFTITYNFVDYLVKVKEGNYSSDELLDYLNNNVFSAAPYSGNVEAAFDTRYGKFIIQLTPAGIGAGDTIDLDFRLQDALNRDLFLNMGWLMGYRNERYQNLQSYEPEAFYDAGGPRYFILAVDDFKRNVDNPYIAAYDEFMGKTNVLARLPQLNGINDILFNDAADLIYKKREYFGPVDIEKLKIQVLDEYERIIDNNNMDFSLTLEFECVYNL